VHSHPLDPLDVADRSRELAFERPVQVDLLGEGAPPHAGLVEELEADAATGRHRRHGEREPRFVDGLGRHEQRPALGELVGDLLVVQRLLRRLEVLGQHVARDRPPALLRALPADQHEEAHHHGDHGARDEPTALRRDALVGVFEASGE